MIHIDGSMGEGGGQILRTSLALSLLTGKSFQMRELRAGRSKPGLQPQHLVSVRAAAAVGQAAVEGDALGSQSLTFHPGEVVAGNYQFTIKTAGAVSLVLHSVYLPLACRGKTASSITLTGGTHVPASPCFHFLQRTWRSYLGRLGIRIALEMQRPGFYPRGGGVMTASLETATTIHGLHLEMIPRPVRCQVISAVASLPDSIAHRQAGQAAKELRELGMEARVQEETWENGPGTMLAIELDTEPVPTVFFELGQRGKPAEKVAGDAVDQVRKYLDCRPIGVDSHSADQLLLPLALAGQESNFAVSETTSHLLTNIAVIQNFVDRKITCDGSLGGQGVVRVHSTR